MADQSPGHGSEDITSNTGVERSSSKSNTNAHESWGYDLWENWQVWLKLFRLLEGKEKDGRSHGEYPFCCYCYINFYLGRGFLQACFMVYGLCSVKVVVY
jgi:hypothetical protein